MGDIFVITKNDRDTALAEECGCEFTEPAQEVSVQTE